MTAGQHGLPGFASTTCHDQFLARFVQQINMGVVIIEGGLYLLHDFCNQLFLIQNCRETTAHFCRGCQRFCAVCHTLFERGDQFTQLCGHHVERHSKSSNFFCSANRGLQLDLAVCDTGCCPCQFNQGH